MSHAPHVFVVTCPVPRSAGERLRVEVAGRTMTALGSDGFMHVFELPPDVAIERLGWQVYADVLEVHAPYRRGPRSRDADEERPREIVEYTAGKLDADDWQLAALHLLASSPRKVRLVKTSFPRELRLEPIRL